MSDKPQRRRAIADPAPTLKDLQPAEPEPAPAGESPPGPPADAPSRRGGGADPAYVSFRLRGDPKLRVLYRVHALETGQDVADLYTAALEYYAEHVLHIT